ncbi:MAG: four helix bundle protein [Fidelibacterota bacterium]
MAFKYHKDLDIWKASIELVVDIYKQTSDFPAEEKYSIVSQLLI